VKPEDIALTSAPRLGDEAVTLRWLGTAGFELRHDGWTVLVDPYITRAPLRTCALSRLESDGAAIRRHVSGADAIVCGHTHFDHVLDVPAIARLTGARVFGSRSAVNLCRAAGIAADRLCDVESQSGERRAEVGPFELTFVPSAHSPLLAGRVPFAGEIADCDQVPSRAHQYRCGAVFAVTVRVAGRVIHHVGSANLLDEAPLPSREVDALLLCVAGWTTSPRFVPRLLQRVSPATVVLSHWDDFFRPIERPARMLPAMQLPRLVEALAAASPSTRVGTLPLCGQLAL
jgi:L-ascorbate metabolism protein UlaG (beta-lactamase superfamily)